MRKILPILFIIVLFLVFVLLRNNDSKNIISQLIKNENIHKGKLRYRIYLLGVFPIGEAAFMPEQVEEYKGQRVYHLSATAQSLKIFSQLFSGYATLDSYVDMQQLNPIVFKQKLVIRGKNDIDREVTYDQKQGIMSIAGVRRQILPNTQDPISAIFNIRRMNFDQPQEFEISINTNQKNYILKGTALPKDISIHNKTYKTAFLRAQISRRDKNPYHKSSISMVLWREKENMPILIKVFASGFLINARLTEIK